MITYVKASSSISVILKQGAGSSAPVDRIVEEVNKVSQVVTTGDTNNPLLYMGSIVIITMLIVLLVSMNNRYK